METVIFEALSIEINFDKDIFPFLLWYKKIINFAKINEKVYSKRGGKNGFIKVCCAHNWRICIWCNELSCRASWRRWYLEEPERERCDSSIQRRKAPSKRVCQKRGLPDRISWRLVLVQVVDGTYYSYGRNVLAQ